MSNPNSEVVVSPAKIRHLFNSHILPKKNQGLLSEQVKRSKHPAPPGANEPYCTRSQMVIYLDEKNQKVAWVHRYLRENGDIGGSGKPDPKRIILKGVAYIAKQES